MRTGGSSTLSSPQWLYIFRFKGFRVPPHPSIAAYILSFKIFLKEDSQLHRIFFNSFLTRLEFSSLYASCSMTISLYLSFSKKISCRPISIGQLNALLRLHLRPIYPVVFRGSSALRLGYLILRWVSRLDAFSVYLVRTSLLCYAVGTTTDAQAVRSFRSSRTKNNASQISCAHDG